jgi:hypothetical protein
MTWGIDEKGTLVWGWNLKGNLALEKKRLVLVLIQPHS